MRVWLSPREAHVQSPPEQPHPPPPKPALKSHQAEQGLRGELPFSELGEVPETLCVMEDREQAQMWGELGQELQQTRKSDGYLLQLNRKPKVCPQQLAQTRKSEGSPPQLKLARKSGARLPP
jgi:hypothetical protein